MELEPVEAVALLDEGRDRLLVAGVELEVLVAREVLRRHVPGGRDDDRPGRRVAGDVVAVGVSARRPDQLARVDDEHVALTVLDDRDGQLPLDDVEALVLAVVGVKPGPLARRERDLGDHELAVGAVGEGVVDEVGASLDLLASAEANILTMLLALETGEATTLGPPEAIAYAREAAARRAPLAAVLRGYRLGVEHWLRWCTPVIEARLAAADQADELQRAAQVAIRYGDHLSERLQRNTSASSKARPSRELRIGRSWCALCWPGAGRAGARLDVARLPRARQAPGSRAGLDRPSERALPMLEAEVRALTGRVGASAQLTIASGLTSVHAWLALARTTWTLGAPAQDGILMGLGTAGEGIEGFRHSHTQAKRALDVARLARTGRFGPVVCYEQVRLLDVLSQDMSLAREFVIAELGGLASTDARARELRTTLLEFLAANRSYQAVARSSHLHRTPSSNAWHAPSSSSAPRSPDRQLEVQTALQLADRFDDRMLTATISRRRTA